MAKIGVVTVTFNSGIVLNGFMQSMLKQNHNDWILYVIDNDSRDNTLELLATYPQDKIKVIANKINYGVAKGNNQGIEASLDDGCDFVLLLNNDTEFNDDMFTILLNEMVLNQADMVTPKIMYFEPRNKIWCAGGEFIRVQKMIPLHTGADETDIGQYDQSRFCSYTPTCCVLISKQTIIDVGLMDEKYFVYIDDVDWMYRAIKLNNKKLLYTANTILFHKVSSLTGGGDSPFTIKMCNRNMIYFLRKHSRTTTERYCVLGEFFARSVVRLGLQLLRKKITIKQLKMIIRAFKDGLIY